MQTNLQALRVWKRNFPRFYFGMKHLSLSSKESYFLTICQGHVGQLQAWLTQLTANRLNLTLQPIRRQRGEREPAHFSVCYRGKLCQTASSHFHGGVCLQSGGFPSLPWSCPDERSSSLYKQLRPNRDSLDSVDTCRYYGHKDFVEQYELSYPHVSFGNVWLCGKICSLLWKYDLKSSNFYSLKCFP